MKGQRRGHDSGSASDPLRHYQRTDCDVASGTVQKRVSALPLSDLRNRPAFAVTVVDFSLMAGGSLTM